MATHSSTLSWKIPWTEEPGRLQSMGSRRVGHLLSNFTFTFHLHALEKAMATHSSVLALENLRDGWAWWAAVYGVAQSQIRLKRLSSSIYSFPLVRSSCPLSAGVLHAHLCLKVYSWCTCGERCTPCPPTPLPSCSLKVSVLMSSSFIHCFTQQNFIKHF